MRSPRVDPPGLVELGDVVALIRDSVDPRTLADDSIYVGLDDIASNSGEIVGISQIRSVKSKVSRFEAGDVLYGRLRPYLNKVAAPDRDGAASGELLVLRPSPLILPAFLQRVLLSAPFVRYASTRTKGDRPRTSFKAIASFAFELPTLEAQSAICAQIERLAAAGAQLTETLLSLKEHARHLVEGMRSHLLSGPVERGDAVVRLADVAERIQYGTARKSHAEPGGLPVLRIPNVVSGEITLDDLKYGYFTKAERAKLSLEPGDILVVRSNGSLGLVGRAAITGKSERGFLFAGYLLRIRPSPAIRGDFLLQALKSRRVRRLIEQAARSSSGVNNLNAAQLGALPIHVPDREAQQRAATILATLEQTQRALTSRIDRLNEGGSTLLRAAQVAWLGGDLRAGLGDILRSPTAPVDRPSLRDEAPAFNAGIAMLTDPLRHLSENPDSIPEGGTTFTALMQAVQADYDLLRDAVFEMMSSEPPSLAQRFEVDGDEMLLVRPS